MLRHLLVPWRPAPLLLVAAFTAGLALAARAGLVGILPAFLFVSWFFKYCFVLSDAMIAGEEEPPVLSVEMVNPLDEQRPLVQAVIIAAGWGLASFAGAKFGTAAGALTGGTLLAALPASVAVLTLSGNPFRAVWPVDMAALVRGMGRDYAWILLATLGCGTVLYGLARAAFPLSVTLAVAQLAFLTLFALLGGAVHENRFALGIPTRTRAERRAERDLQEHTTERKRMLDRSFAHLRLGRAADAWAEIEQWIARHCPDSIQGGPRAHEEYPALIESASQWSDPRIADRLASDYLARLLARRENGKALEILERRLAANPQFRPEPAARAARLRELAALAGKRALSRALGTDDPRSGVAGAMAVDRQRPK